MSVQYRTVDIRDADIIDLELVDSTSAPESMKGMVQTAIKITAGIPVATPNMYMVGALVQNAVDGVIWSNVGTVALPVWDCLSSCGSVPPVPPSPYDLGNADGYQSMAGTTLTLTNPQFFTTGNIGETTLVGVPTFGTGSDLGSTGLAAAQANFVTLYNTLMALSGTAIISPSAIESGNYGYGAGVFVPGVYTTASAIGMTAAKTITLSGAGDYVFKSTGGAIVFGATDNIVLTNGATADRVFWVADADITTGSTDNLKGNFMSGGDITIGSTNNIEGRLLAPGAITINGTATSLYLPL